MVTELTAANFKEKVLDVTDKPVLVDFWASWCGPCKMMSPVIDEISQSDNRLHVCKCDTDANQGLAAQYGISAIPTCILFKGGKPVAQTQGAMPKEALMAQIAQYL